MPPFWKEWFRRTTDGPVLLEQIVPLEVPVLTEVKRLLTRGERARAIRYGYLKAIEDCAYAFRVRFPTDATHVEFLATAMGPGTPLWGQREIYERAYRMYETVRYGGFVTESDDFVAALTSIYAPPPMFCLYASTKSSQPTFSVVSPRTLPPADPPSGALPPSF
ncbi:MAG: hypothetical protein ACREB9_05275 [Thermoplasmata archaeon]